MFANETAADITVVVVPLLSGMSTWRHSHGWGRCSTSSESGAKQLECYRGHSIVPKEPETSRRPPLAAVRSAGFSGKQGRYGEAKKWLRQAHGAFEGLRDSSAQSQVATELGEIARQTGDYSEARSGMPRHSASRNRWTRRSSAS